VRARYLPKVNAVLGNRSGEIARITRQRHGDARESAVAGKLEVDTGLDDRLPE
jgi:hypothetical protein